MTHVLIKSNLPPPSTPRTHNIPGLPLLLVWYARATALSNNEFHLKPLPSQNRSLGMIRKRKQPSRKWHHYQNTTQSRHSSWYDTQEEPPSPATREKQNYPNLPIRNPKWILLVWYARGINLQGNIINHSMQSRAAIPFGMIRKRKRPLKNISTTDSTPKAAAIPLGMIRKRNRLLTKTKHNRINT